MNPVTESEYLTIMENCKNVLFHLYLIAKSSKEEPEGGTFYTHKSFNTSPDFKNKQKNLMSVARTGNKILEIGFNMGHSTLFMLEANPNCVIHCFDICEHPYTKPCFEYLESVYKNRIFLHEGKSVDKLQEFHEIMDVCHIDGCHDPSVANLDFFLCLERTIGQGIIVFDDTWLENLKELWNGYVRNNLVTEIQLLPVDIYEHRIGRVNRPRYKIAMCSLALGEEYKRKVKYGIQSKKEYCKNHRYDFRDDEDVFDKSRPPAWSKVKLIQKCLESEEKYDYVVWIDADTYIMNPNKFLEDFISNLSEGKDVLISSDWSRINSGVIFNKNTAWTRKFYDTVYEQVQYIYHDNWEQQAIQHIWDSNLVASKEHMNVLHFSRQKEFNSYYFLYTWGDFVIHLAGCFRDNVDTGLEEMMLRVNPLRTETDTNESFNQRIYFLQGLNK